MLVIEEVGLEQYAPGGSARVKAMVIGGPGAGKTRWASYFPDPIYADVEGGLASVADRGVKRVAIKTSKDMLDLLAFLDLECQKPETQRQFLTVVIDTLDTYQRKVKDEWLRNNRGASTFTGYDAWGYLDTKMQQLMTRLLNLDMNVIVIVHPTEKTVDEGTGDAKTTRTIYQLQLQGSMKDQSFNDFDLVGWMGTYWEAEDGARVQKRGLTFKPTPDKPFLKDRLYVTPPWLEVKFDEEDYTNLFAAIVGRLDEFSETKVVGEIPDHVEGAAPAGEGVVAPSADLNGALPPQDPETMPLDQLTKPQLISMARALPAVSDKVKTNLLKAELIDLVNEGRAAKAANSDNEDAPEASQPEPSQQQEAPAEPTADASSGSTEEPADAPAEPETDTSTDVGPEADASTDVGATGAAEEAADPPATDDELAEQLGASLIGKTAAPAEATGEEESAPAPAEAPAPSPSPAAEADVCAVCGKDLAGENQDYVRLSYIKYQQRLCQEHYVERKKG